MEEKSRDVIGLLEVLTEQNRQQTASLKKQLFVTRILAAVGCVLAAAVIAVFLLIVPPMLQIIRQGQETLVEATDTLQTAQETLTEQEQAILDTAINVDYLVCMKELEICKERLHYDIRKTEKAD